MTTAITVMLKIFQLTFPLMLLQYQDLRLVLIVHLVFVTLPVQSLTKVTNPLLNLLAPVLQPVREPLRLSGSLISGVHRCKICVGGHKACFVVVG